MSSITLSALIGRNKDNYKKLENSILSSSELPFEIIHCVDQNIVKFTIDDVDDRLKGITKILYGYGKQPELRNIILKEVKTDFIWFIDDDVTISTDSIKNLVFLSSTLINFESEVGAIAGKIIEPKKSNFNKPPIYMNFFQGFVGDFNFNISHFKNFNYKWFKFSDKLNLPIVDVIQGTSMVFFTKTLKEIGGFNESLSHGYSSFEDSEPLMRLKSDNKIIVYSDLFELIHHKAPRINDETRGFENMSYQISFFRNFIISVISNKYPSFFKSLVFCFVFSLTHFLRCSFYFKSIRKGSSIIIKGYNLAFVSLHKTNFKRKSFV